ncbi:MAG TPA: PrgI family protein [Candidatus Paceibacterota bacterium]|nr:PrgI family protein [Candidatus Paceibacterota bacterium]
MQFQVPQFIDTEDKVVGPLSLRQFAYVAGAAILSAMVYFTAQFWLWIAVSAVVFAAAIAFAFVKIEGRPFQSILISAFNFYWRPQTYVWQPEHAAVKAAERETQNIENESALEEIIAKSAPKKIVVAHPAPKVLQPVNPAAAPAGKPKPITRETVKSGSALHKAWEDIQTGARKTSDKQFLEKKMAERYQIFQRISGDRGAARRVDYR